MNRILATVILLLAPATFAGTRRTIVISDTHFGVGRCAQTLWHPYEDFRWHTDFKKFLGHLRKESPRTDLVLNGDTFELWQSLQTDCAYKDTDLSCTEREARERLTRVLQEHSAALAELRDFANHQDNRVIIVPGNHDAALLFTKVAEDLIGKINAKPGRVTIATQGHWVSGDGLIVAAHGHQMDETNAYERWPDVFRTVGDERHLERPWGEQFVQEYYNALERIYPVIDNIAGEAESIRYGIAAEGKLRAIKHAGRFAKFFLFSVSGRQLGDVLATPEVEKKATTAEWNIPAIRKDGAMFFAESVPRDDLTRPAIDDAVKAGLFDGALETLSDEDINAICNERAALAESGVDIQRCQPATLSAVFHKLTTTTNERILRYLKEIRRGLPRREKPGPAFKLAVFSHTHAARDSFDAQVSNEEWVPRVLNTGAWHRLIDGHTLRALLAERGVTPKDALNTLTHSDLPASYPYVVIEPYEKVPAGKLHYWKGVTLPRGEPRKCP